MEMWIVNLPPTGGEGEARIADLPPTGGEDEARIADLPPTCGEAGAVIIPLPSTPALKPTWIGGDLARPSPRRAAAEGSSRGGVVWSASFVSRKGAKAQRREEATWLALGGL